ncbi:MULTISPECIES: peptide deformylase [Niastella]|uniref:Peptide deformylase n=1 Tax=Niastella soli TaxID=2821487 RepID=A0ABS3YP80_9BACT|nr:peptide deformylase [Niastella soli]MBO9199686.1 peptide deformylase [Niastella soli]
MQLPILSYGHSVLREQCHDIDSGYPELTKLIENMWETMYGANGCGLAAPQVNVPVRLFLVDSKTTYDKMDDRSREDYFAANDTGIIETFINAAIIDESEEVWTDEEGCLSIPALAEPITRPWSITMEYFNREFIRQTKTFYGTTARMIQHEYDHTERVLYLDHLKPLKRKLLQGKLEKISKGLVKAKYPMKFAK